MDELSESYAFSQYPRPSIQPSVDSDQPSQIHFMGYSVRSARFRLTEWINYDGINFNPLWEDPPVAVELYDHFQDPLENVNHWANPKYSKDMLMLKKVLHSNFFKY
jgi:hypothetical protein